MATMASFTQKMDPFIKRAAQTLGIPYQTVAVQWANESTFGTSSMAVSYNNFAGIKYSKNSSTARKRSDSDFAAYASIDGFVTDYIRVMNLSYYDGVRQAGKTGDVVAATKALGASPYDAGHYNDGSGAGSKLLAMLGLVSGGSSGGSSAALTAAEKQEIARKASLGLPLSNASAAAQAYYESVSGKKYPVSCPTCHRPL